MNADVGDLNLIAKSLKGSWSSHLVSQINMRGASPILSSLQEILNNYDRFSASPNPDDRKVLTRMLTSLLSIIGVEYTQKAIHLVQIRKILERASLDNDEVIFLS